MMALIFICGLMAGALAIIALALFLNAYDIKKKTEQKMMNRKFMYTNISGQNIVEHEDDLK